MFTSPYPWHKWADMRMFRPRGCCSNVRVLAQVSALMWLHTVLNYQYRNGTTLTGSLSSLWRQGGVRRLYRGFSYALILSPATRFVDTAANAGCISLLDSYATTKDSPLAAKTALGSAVAAVTRLVLLPLDILKTMQQVEGAAATALLRNKLRKGGPSVMFHGAAASATSTIISHFPWFYTVRPGCSALQLNKAAPCPRSRAV
jgi:Mitochondrial carrier protein